MRTRLGVPLICAALMLLPAIVNASAWNNPYPRRDEGRNILYSAFAERPNHLDPARSYSTNESVFTGQIYEPPLQYHYLKRPYELVPLTAEEMPRATYYDAAGRRLPADADAAAIAHTVYEIRVRPGIRYQPHPALARDESGALRYARMSPEDLAEIFTLADFAATGTRELVAADYVHQIKRLAHPQLHSPILGVMRKYIVGLDALSATLEQALAQGAGDGFLDLERLDLAGARVVDRYRYRIEVNGKYPQMLYWLAMPFFAPVPPEADRFYAQPGMAARNLSLDWYPIGTGPYLLAVNNPNRQMVLARNPNFRGEPYPSAGQPEDAARGLLADAGRTMPFIDRAVYSLETEDIPYWNKFLQGYYDSSGVQSDSFDQAIRVSGGGDATLTDEMRAQGIRLLTAVATSVFYVGFNMLDAVVGGQAERARKLRHAIAIAVDYEEYISIFLNERGVPAQGPVPPGIFGHREGRLGINPYVYDWVDGGPRRKPIASAHRLLAEAGYPDGIDSRTGQPLSLYFDVTASGPDDKARLDWWRKQFRKLGIRLVVRNTLYNRFQEKMRKGTAQLFLWGWGADYPDPENFLFLLDGRNSKVGAGGVNAANYDDPEFNRLFDRMKHMDNGPARQQTIDAMIEIVQRDAPWLWGLHPKQFGLYHQWHSNTKPHQMANNTLKYQRVDADLRSRLRAQWNPPRLWPLWVGGLVLVGGLVPGAWSYWRKEHLAQP